MDENIKHKREAINDFINHYSNSCLLVLKSTLIISFLCVVSINLDMDWHNINFNKIIDNISHLFNILNTPGDWRGGILIFIFIGTYTFLPLLYINVSNKFATLKLSLNTSLINNSEFKIDAIRNTFNLFLAFMVLNLISLLLMPLVITVNHLQPNYMRLHEIIADILALIIASISLLPIIILVITEHDEIKAVVELSGKSQTLEKKSLTRKIIITFVCLAIVFVFCNIIIN